MKELIVSILLIISLIVIIYGLYISNNYLIYIPIPFIIIFILFLIEKYKKYKLIDTPIK